MKSSPNFIVRLYGSLFVVFLMISFWYEKGDVVLLVNGAHHPFTDIFFRAATHLGDGLVFVIVVIALLFVRFYYAYYTVLVGIVHGLIVAMFKNLLFPDKVRPKNFFENPDALHFIQDVTVHGYHSFPSGHTASAFALATTLSLILKNPRWTLILFLAASIVGYSRIYLLQHFFVDVFAGALLGTLTALLIWYLLERRKRFAWMDKKLSASMKAVPFRS